MRLVIKKDKAEQLRAMIEQFKRAGWLVIVR